MEALSFCKTARRTFHDVHYMLTISGDADSLSIEVEEANDGRRWRSQFAASFIEDITKKTGNVKKFDVFVRMALSALAQESDAVYLDILTARDLEMLRRHANPQGPPTTSTAGQSDKRYLILTYRAEFDKVHYPLPLPLDERSEEEMLRAMVNRLRTDLSEARQTISRLEQDSLRGEAAVPPAREDERVSGLQRQNSELSDQLRVAKREVEQLRSELRLRGTTPASSGSADVAELRRLRETCGRQQAELKALKEESRQKSLASKREVDQATKELRIAKQSVDRLQAQVRKLEDEKRAMGMKLQNASRGPSVDRSRPQSRTPSVERGRTPSRPASRNPPSRPPSRPASRPTSRANSRASSVASSRDRTPSPSSFLDRRGPRSSAERERPWAFQRGNSPNAGPSGRRQVHSPGSTLSPYSRPANVPAARRTPSPGTRSRERTPSPGQRTGAGAGHAAANAAGTSSAMPSRRSALSLREPRSGEAGTSAYPSAASALVGAGRGAKPAPASRYGAGAAGRPGSATRGREQASDAPVRAGSYGAGARAGSYGAGARHVAGAGSDDGSGSQHRPGSLFGLAANLGLGPGSLAMGAGGGAAGAVGPAGPSVVASSGSDAEVGACDIDARLQALQSFLKQTKTMTQ